MTTKTISITVNLALIDIVDYSPLQSAVSNLEYDGCIIINAQEEDN
jgi:hypothetical protein